MHMKKWELVVDHLLQEAIGNGDVSHLPGAGKPLQLEIDKHTPADLRAAHKILDDHNVIPDWIVSRQLLDQAETKLEKRARRRAGRYLAERQAALQAGNAMLLSKFEEDWKRFKQKFMELTEDYNRDVLKHNLAAPPGIPHKPFLQGEQMIERALQAQSSEAKAST